MIFSNALSGVIYVNFCVPLKEQNEFKHSYSRYMHIWLLIKNVFIVNSLNFTFT